MSCEFPYGYKELTRESPVEENINLLEGTFQAVRTFIGPWDTRHAFILTELLKPFTYASLVTNYSEPAVYPDGTIAVASTVKVRGSGKHTVGPNGMAAYERAIISCNYETPTYNVSGGTAEDETNFQNAVFLEESIDSTVQLLTVPGESFKLDPDEEGAEDRLHDSIWQMTIPITMMNILIKQKNIIIPHWGAMKRTCGKVNETAFITPSGFTVGRGKIRYDGPFGVTKVNIDTGGGENFPLPVWELTHRFSYNPKSWNKRFCKKGDPPEWKWRFIRMADGKRPFEYWNLYNVFFGEDPNKGFNQATLNAINTNLQNLYGYLNDDENNRATDSIAQNYIQNIRSLRMSLGWRL